MPKQGIILPPEVAEKINQHLRQHKLSKEAFAKEKLGVSPRTLNNWLNSRNGVPQDKLDLLVEALGIGLEDLFGGKVPETYQHYNDVTPTLRLIYEGEVARLVRSAYSKVAKLFWQQISFSKYPVTGYFQTFKHDPKQGVDYYVKFRLIPEQMEETMHFFFRFTIAGVLRINYGEVILNSEEIQVIQYYQPPNYTLKRTSQHYVDAVTWLDKAAHTFIISSDKPFKLEMLGRISTAKLEKQKDHIAVFWKHFFFHAE